MSVYSHSKLETYQNCPLKYKFQYIDRLQRKKQGIEAFLGSRVHETLEKLYRDLLNGKRNEPADLLNYYQEQWDKNWKEGKIKIVRRQYTPEDYRAAGRECIEKYYTHYSPFDGDSTLGVEIQVNFNLNHDGRYRMMGFIDRLARGKNGIWEIHDYKTSSSLPSQKEVDEKSQLALYQIGLQQKWPQIQEVNLVWHYLRFDTALSTTWTSSQLNTLQQKTMKLIDQIEAAPDFPPQESNLCSWCDFQNLCPLKMHPLRTSSLPPEEFSADEGVNLVNQYADLTEQRDALQQDDQALETRMRELEQKIISYARQAGLGVIMGSQYLARIHSKKNLKLPKAGENQREELEELLRQAGKWEEVARLNLQTLKSKLAENQWDQGLVQKLKRFATEEEESKVRLTKKQEDK